MVSVVLGSAAALASACSWAIGAILFRRLGDSLSPVAMNLTKSVIGTLYLGVVLLLFGFGPVNRQDFLFLGLSGLLGIAIGDSFFFKSLMYLGARLTVLAEMSGPILTVVLAVVLLDEKISLAVAIGMILVLTGVTWVLWEHAGRDEVRIARLKGVGFSLLSGLCMSASIILAKKALANTSAIQATFIRIFWAALSLSAWGLVSRSMNSWVRPLSNHKLLRLALLAAFVAIFGGFWLFLVALKFIDASIATVLNSTTPLFILPLSALMLKENISVRSLFGVCIAILGVALLILH